jgi:hypothetical protein
VTIGSAVGAMAFTLGPFLHFYMGQEWTPPQLLVYLLTVRLLITGIGAGPGYLLLGSGEFKTLARLEQRELVLAIGLGLLLGFKFGSAGIALGFLLATVAGTFSPLFYAYAKSIGQSGGLLMWQSWWRGALACTISGTVAALLLPMASSAWRSAAIGVIAAAVALTSGVAASGVRFGAMKPLGDPAPAQAGGEHHPPKSAQDHVEVEMRK